MYVIDTSTFWHFLQSFFTLVGGALRLDPAAFSAVQESVGAGTTILTVLILVVAGVSMMLGQSVVLLANKVAPRGFVSSLLFNGIIFVVGLLIWAGVFLFIGHFVFGKHLLFSQIARAVGLAYAPLLLGFFILLPYLGSFLHRVLDIWWFLAILVALSVTLQLNLERAFACALIGFVFIEALKYTVGRPVVALQRRLERAVAGTEWSHQVKEPDKVSEGMTATGSKGGRT